MKKYITPDMSVIFVMGKDVITLSNGGKGDGSGEAFLSMFGNADEEVS